MPIACRDLIEIVNDFITGLLQERLAFLCAQLRFRGGESGRNGVLVGLGVTVAGAVADECVVGGEVSVVGAVFPGYGFDQPNAGRSQNQ
jgi:hypothetical protein